MGESSEEHNALPERMTATDNLIAAALKIEQTHRESWALIDPLRECYCRICIPARTYRAKVL